MTSHDPESRLGRVLDEQARVMDGTDIGLDEVKRTARGIRRRRRTVTGLAAAAVVAVAVPVGLNLPSFTTATAPPVASHSRLPSQGPSLLRPTQKASAGNPTALPAGPVRTVDLTSAGQGPAPHLAYLRGTVIHLGGGGGTATVPAGQWTSFASYHGGWLLVGRLPAHPRRTVVVQVDAQGNIVSTQPSYGDIAASSDGTEIAWFAGGGPGRPGQVVTDGASSMGNGPGSGPSVPAGKQAEAAGFLPGGGVAYNVGHFGPNGRSYPATVLSTDPQGNLITHSAPKVEYLEDVSESNGLGVVSIEPGVYDASCSGVMRMSDNTVLWTTCNKDEVQWMSSDGRYTEGPMSNGVVVVRHAATGQVAVNLRLSGAAMIRDVVWEDDAHLLVTVLHLTPGAVGQTAAVYRVGLDGSAQLVVGPVSASSLDANPVVWQAHP